MTKSEIEQELQGKGDFVQIDYLEKFLKEPLTMEMKKFILLKIGSIYENAKMFDEAAKMYDSAAGISLSFFEKIKNYLKATECYVKTGEFDRMELSVRKALGEANSREKEDVYASVRMFLREQARVSEAEMKRNHAAKYYEKLLEMGVDDKEKEEIREKLIYLYDKLGQREKSMLLERGI